MFAQFTSIHKIFVLSVALASATGCRLIGIPSHRFESSDGPWVSDNSMDCCLEGPGCAPGVLPPMPGWLAKLHEKHHTPQPATHPRFQPLPTRPMFSQAGRAQVEMPVLNEGPYPNAQGGMSPTEHAYGHWPKAEEGGPAAYGGQVMRVAEQSFDWLNSPPAGL